MERFGCWRLMLFILFFAGACADDMDDPWFLNVYRSNVSSNGKKRCEVALFDINGRQTRIDSPYGISFSENMFQFHTAPSVQIEDGKRIFYHSSDLYEYDIESRNSSKYLDARPPKGAIVSFKILSHEEKIVIVREWRGTQRLLIKKLQSSEEDLILEIKGAIVLHRGCLSNTERYVFVVLRWSADKYEAKVIDLQEENEVAFGQRLMSDRMCSIAWNPWGLDDQFYISLYKHVEDRWQSIEVDIRSRSVRYIGDASEDYVTPCFFNDMIVVTEWMEAENEFHVRFMNPDRLDVLPSTLSEGRSYNPMTFRGNDDYILYIKDDGGTRMTMLYNRNTGQNTPILESADPKPRYLLKSGLLLLSQCQRSSSEYVAEGVIYEPNISLPQYPANLFVFNTNDLSMTKVAEDSIFAAWIDE